MEHLKRKDRTKGDRVIRLYNPERTNYKQNTQYIKEQQQNLIKLPA